MAVSHQHTNKLPKHGIYKLLTKLFKDYVKALPRLNEIANDKFIDGTHLE